MPKSKVDINKINEIISHIGYAYTVIEEAQKKVLLLDLANIPDGDDHKKKIGHLFDESKLRFEDIYAIIKALYVGTIPEDRLHMIYSNN
jgi:hypothetical protein